MASKEARSISSGVFASNKLRPIGRSMSDGSNKTTSLARSFWTILSVSSTKSP